MNVVARLTSRSVFGSPRVTGHHHCVSLTLLGFTTILPLSVGLSECSWTDSLTTQFAGLLCFHNFRALNRSSGEAAFPALYPYLITSTPKTQHNWTCLHSSPAKAGEVTVSTGVVRDQDRIMGMAM